MEMKTKKVLGINVAVADIAPSEVLACTGWMTVHGEHACHVALGVSWGVVERRYVMLDDEFFTLVAVERMYMMVNGDTEMVETARVVSPSSPEYAFAEAHISAAIRAEEEGEKRS